MHKKILLCLMTLCCYVTSASAGTYFDQRQHNSFFFFGNWGGHVTSECFLYNDLPQDEAIIPEQTGYCYFDIQRAKQPRHLVQVRYEDLKVIHPKLVTEIEAYVQDLIENHPPNVFQKIFAFKDHDYELLENFAGRFKYESLPYQVLLRRDFQTYEKTPQFFNKGIVEELLKIFESNLEPYRIN
ncbi:MAG: hypothetical protein M9899_03490 [Bdellovibrionaceae bacterium]|nr:hypothetical protein [Pseudobdellovibrionaceae bacterium]